MSFYSRDERILVVSGSASFQLLQESISSAAADLINQNDNGEVMLHCDSTVHRNNTVSLVFSDGEFFMRNKSDANKIYGAHANLWNSNGVYRAFSGARMPIKSSSQTKGARGDVIEMIGGQPASITTNFDAVEQPVILNQPISDHQAHPSNLVFLVADNNLPPVSEISNQQAQLFVLSGLARRGSSYFSGFFGTNEVAARVNSNLSKLLSSTNVRSFVANTANAKRPFSGDEFEMYFPSNQKSAPKNPKELEPLQKEAVEIVKRNFPSVQI